MLWRVFQLLLFPSSFIRDSVENDVSEGADKEEYRKEAQSRVYKKRVGFLVSFMVVLFVVSLGFGAAAVTNRYIELQPSVVLMIRVFSISIVAWSVLSRLGYESETWKGQTLLEKTSLFSFKFFYCLGLFLAVWSLLIE